jgi:phosphate transport system permease protein
MGLSAPAPARRNTAAWVLLSRTLIPLSALLTVVIALGLAAVLAVRGWQDLWFVIVSPSPQGVGGAVLSSLALLTVALPIVAIVAFCAAASLWDARIGGSAPKILRGWLPWATGLPPVIAGAAIFFLLVMLGLRLSLFTAAVGLIVLNTPIVCARMLRILLMLPRTLHEAASASGAGPVFVLFRVSLPRAARELFANVSQSAAEMTSQAAVIILAGGVWGKMDPLAVQVWHFAPDRSLARVEAAQCIVLLLFVLVFALIAEGLAGGARQRAMDA